MRRDPRRVSQSSYSQSGFRGGGYEDDNLLSYCVV
jgi:hypothetical protein